MNRALTAILCCATLPCSAAADTSRDRDAARLACEAALEIEGIAPGGLAAVSIRPDGGGYAVSGKIALDAGPDASFSCFTEAGIVIDLRIRR